jgi:thimet oligopeptidase
MLRVTTSRLFSYTRVMLALSDYQLLHRRIDDVAACDALFPKTTDAVSALVATAKAQTAKCVAALESLPEDKRDFEHVARSLDWGESNLNVAASVLAVTKDTNANPDVREAASNAVVELQKLAIDAFASNRKIYQALKSVPEAEVKKQSTQRQYWYVEKLADLRRKGLELPDDKFQQVIDTQKKLAELDTAFQRNISEDKRKVIVPVAECEGIPQHVLDACKKVSEGGSESYELGMDYPTYFGVMKNCAVASTRKKMATAFENRAYPQNLSLLHEVISLRHRLAELLGYKSYAHLDLSDKMAKEPETAGDFVESLLPRLGTKWAAEKHRLIDAGLHPSVKLTTDEPKDQFQVYDLQFVMNQFKEKHLSVDEQKIREYFPLESTVKALYEIYEKFFDVSFETVSGEFWHKDVSAMAVTDRRTKKLLGHVVLDLFPREGKYSHACCHGILPPVRREDDNGTFSPAVTVVLANFPAATEEQPALFMHDDVVTFFHEFGHAIHFLFGRADMTTVSGYNVKMDFVELPSQMLEEWMWDKEILKLASKHYKTGEPLPDALIDSKIESKRAFSGRDGLRQMSFAAASLTFFGPDVGRTPTDQMDTTKIQQGIEERILVGMRSNPDGHFQCSFGHLMGYAACYYGYMWSKVFALDVFDAIKEQDGLLSANVGRKYADAILTVGGGRDPSLSLHEFLGREPRSDAFFKDMGL